MGARVKCRGQTVNRNDHPPLAGGWAGVGGGGLDVAAKPMTATRPTKNLGALQARRKSAPAFWAPRNRASANKGNRLPAFGIAQKFGLLG